ncbi:hypothetical protein QO004_003764 [Rhizobium mesoamericanum]|nr:hypothetical protein [Rhizobium mesoamericanum]
METTLEVLSTGKSGREFHRHWPDEVKARIVSESLRPPAPTALSKLQRLHDWSRQSCRPRQPSRMCWCPNMPIIFPFVVRPRS